MSHPARLSLRAPPHLPFIQGYPGIPGSSNRKQAAVCGTVEVRVGAAPIKAKWVRVEIRKHECLPPGFSAQGETWELVGEIMTLWQAQGKEFDNLETADFKFFLPLPETIPPSVEMMKGTGVWYELVAALSYRKKGGIFKADAATIMKVTEPLRIVKHELHSAWPVYNNMDQKTVQDKDVTMTVQRPGVTFGPGDRILLTATLRSSKPLPFKLRGYECTLYEVVTAIPPPVPKDAKRKSKPPSQPVIKSRQIAQARCAVDESVGRGGEKSARIDMAAPADLLVTVRNAKTLDIGYELRVKAVCDGFEGPMVAGIKYVVGTYNRGSALQAVNDIGLVTQLCPAGPSNPSSPPSSTASPEPPRQVPNGFTTPPSRDPAPQGFPANDWRRKSSSTTTTTTMTERASDMSPAPSQRAYSTVPNRQALAFPTAHPASSLQRSASTTISEYSELPTEERYVQSDIGQSNDRASVATAATFGNWDKGLSGNLNQKSPSPGPSTQEKQAGKSVKQNWDTAEREKLDLYNSARQAAVTTQQTAGIPLEQIGLTDIPDTAPPEYTPPAPAVPPKSDPPIAAPSTILQSAGNTRSSTPANSNAPTHSSRITPSVALASPSAGPSTSAGVSAPRTSEPSASSRAAPAAPVVGVLSEKEQMRRYYEARDKVERAARGEPSGSSPRSPAIANPPSKLNDDSQPNSSFIRDAAPSSSAQNTASASASGSGQASGSAGASAPKAYLSAEEEKEMMRQRYEDATNRVARATGLTSPVVDSPPAFSTLAPTSSSTAPSAAGPSYAIKSSAAPAPYLSAAQEKEQMRKRFEEATQRVAKARMSEGGAPSSPFTNSDDQPISPPISPNPVGGSSSSRSVSQPIHSITSKPGFMSAEQEKEAMRKRFEDATAAVSRARQPNSIQEVISPAPPSPASPIQHRVPEALPAATVPNSAKAANPSAPPPLPSKPPAEYINLLSPATETPPHSLA